MNRREFLVSAGAAAGLAAAIRPGSARAQSASKDPAKLARIAIMSFSFQAILKNANMESAGVNPAANLPAGQPQLRRTLDLMDIGEVFADKWGVHNVEMQHTYFPSTEESWLKAFKARLAKTKSRVSNINLEFGDLNISNPASLSRLQCIDLTKAWIDHAVVLGSPRVMVNQGQLNDETKPWAIEALKAMADYGKTKGIKVGMENRGGYLVPGLPQSMRARGAGPAPAAPPTPREPAYPVLVEVMKASGTYANCDFGNFPDQDMQLAGIRAMLPITDGNSHVKINHQRYDLAKALQLARQLGYTGLFSIEAVMNNSISPEMGMDPYQNVQMIYDILIANL